MKDMDNGMLLRELIAIAGLTQVEALARFNRGQAKPMALRTLKSYLAKPNSKSRVICPDTVIVRMRKVLKITSNKGG